MEILLLFCVVLLAIIQYLCYRIDKRMLDCLEDAIEQYERLLEEDDDQT